MTIASLSDAVLSLGSSSVTETGQVTVAELSDVCPVAPGSQVPVAMKVTKAPAGQVH